MTIVYRQTKGSPLSYAELDGNFADLAGRTDLAWVMEGVEPSPRPGDPDGAEPNLFRNGIYAYTYFAGQTTQAYANFDVPFDWATDTDLYAAIHWSPGNSTATGDVRFGLEFTYANVDGTFGASDTFYISGTSDGTAYKHYQSISSSFPGTLVEANTRFLIRIFRDGGNVADTLAADLFIVGFDLYYQTNKFGLASFSPPYP